MGVAATEELRMKGKTTILAVAAVLTVGSALAQKPAGKSPQKPAPAPAQQPGRIVLGTNQMAGDNGKFGLTYTIGQQRMLNITLTDARFSVERFNCGSYALTPGKDEKLLILTYTIHNPNPELTPYNSGTLKFTAVDQEDVNHEGQGQVVKKGLLEPLSVDLKPAQKIEVQAAILVPAKGTVPKLIVQHDSKGAVLRYDLREALKPLPAPFAGEGFDAVPTIKGEKETYYPALTYDLKFVGTAFQERRLGVHTIGDEKIFFLPKFTFKKQTSTGHILRFRAQAVTEDGDRYEAGAMVKGSVDEGVGQPTEFGQEMTARFDIVIPRKAKITSIRVWEEQGKESRSYVFPVEAQYEKPSAEPVATTGSSSPSSSASNQGTAVTGLQADEYISVFKDSKGAIAMEVPHLESTRDGQKKTEVTVAGQKAVLVEDVASGSTTLFIPSTGELLRAPKAQGKEPQTKLSYFAMAYANSAAPKPKKNNILGQIAGNVLGNAASGLGSQVVSGAVLAGFGQASLPRLVAGSVQSMQGYAVQSFASQLGRAVMTSAVPSEAGGPERVEEQVTVDKNVYVQTSFRGKKGVGSDAFPTGSGSPRNVSATELYKRFADFMASGLPKG